MGYTFSDRSFFLYLLSAFNLPSWMQSIAVYIPTTYVFEGMRSLLLDGVFNPDLMLNGFMLNIVYLIIGIVVFFISFQAARRHGLLLQSGE